MQVSGYQVKELYAPVTVKGQVTIPVEIRKLLGIKPREKVAFRVKGKKVEVVQFGSVVQQTAGAFKTDTPSLSAKKLRIAAEQAIADDVMERMQKKT